MKRTLITALLLTLAACGSDDPSPNALGTASDTGVVTDIGATDTAPKDIGTTDAGTTDSGTTDAGTTDAGTTDAGATDTGATDTGSADTGAADTGSVDAGAPSGVVCGGKKPTFPVFKKSCSVDADCVAKLHQINCCGTQVAHAIAKSDEAAYDTAEKSCLSQYPACGCASTPTVAEDNHIAGQLQDVKAVCSSGVCLATVPAKAGTCDIDKKTDPKAFKWCQTNKDCTYGLIQIDCCGTQAAWGVTKNSKDKLGGVALTCAKKYPKCKCLAKPVQTDDGDNASSGLIQVKCESGFCMTSIKY